MQLRVQQWGGIWQHAEQAHEPKTLQALIYKGQEAAQALKPLSVHHVWKVIKTLGQKAPGLDGAGYDVLKALPYQAMPDLIALLHKIEETATVPNQWHRKTHCFGGFTLQIVVQTQGAIHEAMAAGHQRHLSLGKSHAGHRMSAGCAEKSLHD